MKKNELENLWFSDNAKVASDARLEKLKKAIKKIVSKCKLPGWKVQNYAYDVAYTPRSFEHQRGKVINITYPQVRHTDHDGTYALEWYTGPTLADLKDNPQFKKDMKILEKELLKLSWQLYGGYLLKRGEPLFKNLVRGQDDTAIALRFNWADPHNIGHMLHGKFFR
tara:strand:- start:27 stop:527 length:501 start_codon:yes stop_codon:yes gene_type:complete